MRRAFALAAVSFALGGCGSQAAQQETPNPPRLPRALASSWARQANAVATALAAGDGCTAQTRAAELQRQVVTAVNAHEIPARLLEPLSSGVNDLAVRITCTPPPPPQPEHGKGHGKGHGKPGNREGD